VVILPPLLQFTLIGDGFHIVSHPDVRRGIHWDGDFSTYLVYVDLQCPKERTPCLIPSAKLAGQPPEYGKEDINIERRHYSVRQFKELISPIARRYSVISVDLLTDRECTEFAHPDRFLITYDTISNYDRERGFVRDVIRQFGIEIDVELLLPKESAGLFRYGLYYCDDVLLFPFETDEDGVREYLRGKRAIPIEEANNPNYVIRNPRVNRKTRFNTTDRKL